LRGTVEDLEEKDVWASLGDGADLEGLKSGHRCCSMQCSLDLTRVKKEFAALGGLERQAGGASGGGGLADEAARPLGKR
jgi:hypothetical protein